MGVSRAVRTGLGLIVALAAVEGLVRVAAPVMPEPTTWPSIESDVKQEQIAALSGPVDLVLVGSSVTEAAVDPALLEETLGLETVYNAALPWSSPLVNEIWYGEVVAPRITPETLLIGLSPWPPDEGEGPLGVGIRRALDKGEGGLASWLKVFEKAGAIADWDRLTERRAAKDRGPWTDRGHQTTYYRGAPEGAGEVEWAFGSEMSPDQRDGLERLIGTATRDGTAVVLVVEPAAHPGRAGHRLAQEYVSRLAEHADRWGVELWDTYSMGWDPSLFADRAHFNREGTTAYTKMLAELLAAQRDAGLPRPRPHRSGRALLRSGGDPDDQVWPCCRVQT